jgi:hypothetical protein
MTKSFNIVLNSSATSSYSGDSFNATYYVNMDNFVSTLDYKKAYEVSIRFKSKTNNEADAVDNFYLLSANFGVSAQTQQNSTYSSIVGIISRYSETIGTTKKIYYESFPTDNSPVTLHSVFNIATINIKITTEDMTTTYDELPHYVCILHFKQVTD